MNQQVSASKGSFFSLFDLPVTRFRPEALKDLGQVMAKARSYGPSPIESGYAYLAQFIAHDMTELKIEESDKHKSHIPLHALQQLRTPPLELDSVYGKGFNDPDIRVDKATGKMRLGPTYDADNVPQEENDLPRTKDLTPKIKDKRNDGHLILAQLHLQFLKLHNVFVDKIKKLYPKSHWTAETLFNKARHECILHYQQVVLYDFLYAISDRKSWDYIIARDNKSLWDPVYAEEGRMPLEFSGACFRFSHSMVRRRYAVNNKMGHVDLNILAGLTGRGGMKKSQEQPNGKGLPDDAVIDWSMYFKMPGIKPRVFNSTEKINLSITLKPPGRRAPHISETDLLRGNQLSLPDGQTLVKHITSQHPHLKDLIGLELLSPDELNPEMDIYDNGNSRKKKVLDAAGKKYGFDQKTPLWYYVLAESQCRNRGHTLGPLGSIVIAEVIRSLIYLSQPSVLSVCDWQSEYIQGTGNNGGKKHLKFIDLLMAVNPGMSEL
ncbi:hypothetical protein SG34_029035 [Thalassomonas viridans]|uniref:Heme peroxidase n=1 Tax=Thalassomonas viridans TaxID=137584 RepID=A0AAE9Z2X1_9GAMM|nr:peroxidase family protein [Thalassomonas viridans]WDE05287.1 hypothetical protein SG34_029035 [Thalassomonas viridans]